MADIVTNTLQIGSNNLILRDADAQEQLVTVKDGLASLSSVPTEVRQAILSLFESAAYAETGLTDEITVIEAWAETVTSLTLDKNTVSISGTTTSQIIATTVPAGKTVTWSSSNESVATVSNTGLVTGVGNGTAIITATSGDINAKCTVTVSGIAELVSISAVYTQSGTVYDTDTLDSLKSDLVVTGIYDDSSTATITNYVLSGTLAKGTQTITVTYGGKTDTFTVNVTHYDTSILSWDFTESLTDKKQQRVATLSETGVTQGSTGLVYSGDASVWCGSLDGLTMYTIEIDVTKFQKPGSGNATVYNPGNDLTGSGNGGLGFNTTEGWRFRNANGTWYSVSGGTGAKDATIFDGKTMKIQIDRDVSNTYSLYADDVFVGSATFTNFTNKSGFRVTGRSGCIFTGVRVYEGIV